MKKGLPSVCVCLLFPEVSLFPGYSLKFTSVGSHKCICVYLHSSPLFVHHPFSSGCLIVSACSLATLMAARLIVYFAETAKMLLFLYSVVSVFFSLLFSFLSHVFHHQPSCPQHNPAESYKMSILSKGGGEREQA